MPKLERVAVLTLLLACVVTAASPAQPGVPDPSFNGDGWMAINFGPDSALQALTYADFGAPTGGHLLVGGTAGGARFELRRVFLDGSFDISFGFLGQVFFDVPGATHVEVVGIVPEPEGSGYLVLLDALLADGPTGLLAAITFEGGLRFSGNGYLDLSLEGAKPATDLELCCRSDFVGISGGAIDLSADQQAGWRALDSGPGGPPIGRDIGDPGVVDGASALAALGSEELALFWSSSDAQDTVKVFHDSRNMNSLGGGERSIPGATVEVRAAVGIDSERAVGASWVTSGMTGRPLLLTSFAKTCCSGMVADAGFGTNGVVTFTPTLGTGYDGLRPEEVEHDGVGLVVAATELGGPNGVLRRARVLRFGDDGSLQFEGPGLFGPDTGRDHDVTDMAVMGDGRIALTVTTTDRLNPFAANGWLAVLLTEGLFEDDFESGGTMGWSSTVP